MLSYWIKDKSNKEYPIRFSQSVMMKLAAEEKVHMNEIAKFMSSFSAWPIGRIYRFYHLAFIAGAKKEGTEFSMSEDDFLEWITDDETVMPEVLKAFSNSMPEKKTEGTKPMKSRR